MNNFFKEWKSDFPAGLIVFLVAIPLCLGIALASGAPLFSGLIAGMVGGLVISLLSDSALGVSGPAAGLVAIVIVAIQDLGFESFLLAVSIAGLIQLALGFARAGIIGYYFPSSVIKGMLAAIGLIIILKQIPHALGYDKDYEGDLAFRQEDGYNTFSEIIHAMDFITPGAIVITLVCLAILILWERPFMKKVKAFSIIQGPLVAVIVGIVLNLVFKNFPNLLLEPEHIVAIPVASDFTSFVNQFTLPDFSAISNMQVYTVALTLAIVASIESLLCAEATDKLDPYKRTTNLNTELKAQGVGNLISGLIGGLPVTQVIVRSSTNIQSGGKTRAAAFFHGVLLLLCVALIPNILNLIPLASLAAILFMVGYKLAKPSKFKEMFQLGWTQFAPFVITIIAILLTDLLIGIGIGVVAAVFFILKNNYQNSYWLHSEETTDGSKLKLVLSEDVSFLNKGSILKTLKAIPPKSSVIIDATDSVHIDQDVLDILEDFRTKAAFKEIELEVRGIGEAKEVSRPVKGNLARNKDLVEKDLQVAGNPENNRPSG